MQLRINKNNYQSNINFRNFKHRELEYFSVKMVPETKDLFVKAKNIIEETPNKSSIKNKLLQQTFEKSSPVTLTSGEKAESYLAYPGNAQQGTLVLTDSGDIGMYYRHYDYIKTAMPNYDINKDAQKRIMSIVDDFSK